MPRAQRLEENAQLEYDDLTLPEQITNFILLGFYLTALVYTIYSFLRYKKKSTNAWLIRKSKPINVLIWVSLVCRIVYCMDAFKPWYTGRDEHFLVPSVYLNISSVVFFCVSQFCILICRLW